MLSSVLNSERAVQMNHAHHPHVHQAPGDDRDETETRAGDYRDPPAPDRSAGEAESPDRTSAPGRAGISVADSTLRPSMR